MSAPRLPPIETTVAELRAIRERAAAGPLGPEDLEALGALVETLLWLMSELTKKRVSIGRLQRMLFGARTEKGKTVLPAEGPSGGAPGVGRTEPGPGPGRGPGPRGRRGHGRNGAAAYTGAQRIEVPHQEHRAGELCPGCKGGKLYTLRTPRRLLRVTGQAPLRATVTELERLRCKLCGEVFTARAPEATGEQKYDELAASMIALLKYGAGLPFNRLARLQGGLGIPLPAATQWGIVKETARLLAPAYEELIRQAAQGEVVYNDDTTMKVLELMDPGDRQGSDAAADATDGSTARTGVFTSGIVATLAGRQMALFFTGRRHAGENLARVLAQRSADLPVPIQMCDALSRNLPKNFKTLLANCLAHGRRRFVDLVACFPAECRFAIETLAEVYKTDAEARGEKLSAEARLLLHQARSAPLLEKLRVWMTEQLEQKKVEPNSPLGEAISYMLERWDKLTLFLRVPGAPLDSNLVERALKKAILHRKNSLFYKTQNGARVGDILMSLIYTTELASESPFDYLTALQKHAAELRRDPGAWMPWSYRAVLEALSNERPAPT